MKVFSVTLSFCVTDGMIKAAGDFWMKIERNWLTEGLANIE